LGFLDRINRFLGLYIDTFKAIGRPLTWLPFLVYACLQFLLLLVLQNYVNPVIYPILRPIMALMGEARADFFSHYPEMYLLLPSVYQWGKILIGILFEGLFIGMATVFFITRYYDSDKKIAVSLAFRKWPQLLIMWAIITGVLLLVNMYIPGLFGDILYKSPRRALLFDGFLKLLTVIIYSIFIYAIPAMIVYGENLWGAIRATFRLFAHNPFFSIFLALIPFLLSLPIVYAIQNVNTIVDKFSPELVFYILIAGIAADFAANYFITGTVTGFLISEREQD